MSLVDYGRFVKFSHTIFALPFVLATLAIAGLEMEITAGKVLLIVLAMTSARSCAMAMNRIVDRKIDADNVRTRTRELVTGKISPRNAFIFVVLSALVFLVVSARFNRITALCAPGILVLFLIYPFCKRFTWLSHFFLGFIIGLAPSAAWLALTGTVSPAALWLSLGVMCWIAGFDIIYALLDLEHDRSAKLFSVPACFGVKTSLLLSAGLHLLTLICLWRVFDGTLYRIGLGVMLSVLLYEHMIVKPHDLSRVNMAFFNVNGLASILFFAFTWLEVTIR